MNFKMKHIVLIETELMNSESQIKISIFLCKSYHGRLKNIVSCNSGGT